MNHIGPEQQLKSDVVIVGSGIIGLSIAYHLLKLAPKLSIIVLEKEKVLGLGSTGKCTGGIRYQFSSPVLRRLSLLSRDFFHNFEEEFKTPVWYKEKGYLMLASNKELWERLQRTREQAEGEGIPMKLLNREELLRDYPFLNKDRFLGGTLCPWDAYADPYAVLAALYASVRRQRVEIKLDWEALKPIAEKGVVQGVQTTRGRIWSPVVVNAAGPYVAAFAAASDIKLPVHPFRRQVYVCTNPKGIPQNSPSMIDLASDVYLHQEANGKTVLLGGTDRETWPGLEEVIDKAVAEDFFETVMEVIPSAIDIKWLRTYTGICEQTPDFHPIMGQLSEIKGLFVAGGFSGNGFMHAPGAGRIMADLILKGSTELMDVSLLRQNRFEDGDLREPYV